MGNRCGNSGNSVRLYFWGLQITADGDCSHEIKRHLLLGEKVMTNLSEWSQSCPTLCDPVDHTVHGILQARILEWVAFPFSRGSSQPRDQTLVSNIASRFFTSWATREAQDFLPTEPPGKPKDQCEVISHCSFDLHFSRWGNSGNSVRLYFLGLQNHGRWWLQPWN